MSVLIISTPPYTEWGTLKKGFAPAIAKTARVLPGGAVQSGDAVFKSPEEWLAHLRGETPTARY
jgi:hypothetical protein